MCVGGPQVCVCKAYGTCRRIAVPTVDGAAAACPGIGPRVTRPPPGGQAQWSLVLLVPPLLRAQPFAACMACWTAAAEGPPERCAQQHAGARITASYCANYHADIFYSRDHSHAPLCFAGGMNCVLGVGILPGCSAHRASRQCKHSRSCAHKGLPRPVWALTQAPTGMEPLRNQVTQKY